MVKKDKNKKPILTCLICLILINSILSALTDYSYGLFVNIILIIAIIYNISSSTIKDDFYGGYYNDKSHNGFDIKQPG